MPNPQPDNNLQGSAVRNDDVNGSLTLEPASGSPIHFITLFAGLRAKCDDLPEICFRPQKTAVLLAYLVLKRDSVFSREELADLIWPDIGREESLRNLRQSIYSIRRQLDPDKHGLLVTMSSTVSMNGQLIRTDLDLYEATVRKAEATSDSNRRLRLLMQADQLYTGELLPGFYLDAVIAERNRLCILHQHTLLELANLNISSGNFKSATEFAQRAVDLDPYQEEGHRLLMEIYARSGRSQSVGRQYKYLEHLLRREFGTEPSQTTQNLLDQLSELRPSTNLAAGVDAYTVPEAPDFDIPPNDYAGDSKNSASHAGSDAQSSVINRWKLPSLTLKTVCGTAIVFGVVLVTMASLGRTYRSHTQKLSAINTPVNPLKHPIRGFEVWHSVFPPNSGFGSAPVFAAGDISCEPTAIASDDKSNVYVAGFINTKAHDVDFLTLKYDPDGHLLWQARYNGPGNDVDRARCLAVSPDGCVYVAGESDNGKGTGSRRLKGLDIAIIKYDSNGVPSPTWPDIGFGPGVRRYNGPSDSEDTPIGISVGADGSVIVAGSSWENEANSGVTGRTIVVLKYGANGKLAWKYQYRGGHGDDFACAIAQDADRNILLSGATRVEPPAGPQYKYLTIKISNSGTKLWDRQWGGMSDNIPHNLGIDDSGNIYIVGIACNSAVTPDAERRGCITVKYTPDGQLCWARGTCNEEDRINRIASAYITRHGEVAVAGFGLNRQGIITCRTVYRDENGLRVWAADYGGAQGEDGPAQVAVGTASNVYVCGGLRQNYSDTDSYTLCYNHLGALEWDHAEDVGETHAIDRATAVALTPDHDPVAAVVTYSTHSIHIIRYHH